MPDPFSVPAADECRDIVVIDADRLFRRFVSHSLSHAGMRVRAVSTVEEFWAEIRSERPDLVIIGSDAHGVGADVVCRALRADVAFAGLPIVLSPEQCSRLCEASAMAAGANAVVAKGRVSAPLLDAVDRCLGAVS